MKLLNLVYDDWINENIPNPNGIKETGYNLFRLADHAILRFIIADLKMFLKIRIRYFSM